MDSVRYMCWTHAPRALSLETWQLSAGGLFLLPLTLCVEGLPPSIDTGAGLGYLWLGSVGGLIAYTLWFRGIQRLPVVVPGLLVLLSPLVATLLGVFVAGETFTIAQAIGLMLVVGALAVTPLSGRRSLSRPISPKLATRGTTQP